MSWREVPFETLGQAAGLGGGEGLVERCLATGIEIVLHQNNFFSFGKVDSIHNSR